MSEKLQLSINAVIEKRERLITEWFSEEFGNNSYKYLNNKIIERRKKHFFDEIDTYDGWKIIFTKDFINFFIKELNITDKLCIKIIKNIVLLDASYENDKMCANSILYKNSAILNSNKKIWDCFEKMFFNYNRIKKIYAEKEKFLRLRKKLCSLTDCYKNPDAIKIVCEKCGTLLPAEAEHCSECGNKMIILETFIGVKND